MMALGPIGFLEPWVLAALIVLPAIWWLLRLTPPRPKSVIFPPTRLLMGLEDTKKSSAHSPWWLTALRIIMAALLIGALAGPVLNPDRDALPGSGPVLIVVDNGWASAAQWRARQSLINTYISRAERDQRTVILAGTAGTREARISTLSPQKAREAAASLKPQPYNPDRTRLAERLKKELDGPKDLAVIWLSDGLDYGAAKDFSENLAKLAGEDALAIASPGSGASALGLRAARGNKDALVAQIIRKGGGAQRGTVRALTAQGEQLGEASFCLRRQRNTSRSRH